MDSFQKEMKQLEDALVAPKLAMFIAKMFTLPVIALALYMNYEGNVNTAFNIYFIWIHYILLTLFMSNIVLSRFCELYRKILKHIGDLL